MRDRKKMGRRDKRQKNGEMRYATKKKWGDKMGDRKKWGDKRDRKKMGRQARQKKMERQDAI